MDNVFEKIRKKIANIIRNAPTEVAVIAQQHFEESFDLGGYNEDPFVKWKPRKNPENKKNKGRATLIKTGTLARSLRIISVSKTKIIIGSNVPYAKIHNEGGIIQHPGGTPYLPFNKVYTPRKEKGRISKMGDSQMIFLKKDGTYPEGTRFTKPHPIPIPPRKFIGEGNKKLKKKISRYFEDKIKSAFKGT